MSDRLPARMRALATELTALRVRSGMTTRVAALALGISSASLNRTENAKRAATPEELGGMLAVYGATTADRETVLELSGQLPARGWLGLPADPPALARFEAGASAITEFAPALVPPLLRTPAYSRAVHAVGPPSRLGPAERVSRQGALTRLTAPEYTALLDEAVLRRPVGGAAAMAEQLRLIALLARKPHVTVRVVPFRHGAYRNPGRFSVLSFREETPLVYLEHEGASGFLDAHGSVAGFTGIAAMIESAAVDDAETVEILERAASDFEQS